MYLGTMDKKENGQWLDLREDVSDFPSPPLYPATLSQAPRPSLQSKAPSSLSYQEGTSVLASASAGLSTTQLHPLHFKTDN